MCYGLGLIFSIFPVVIGVPQQNGLLYTNQLNEDELTHLANNKVKSLEEMTSLVLKEALQKLINIPTGTNEEIGSFQFDELQRDVQQITGETQRERINNKRGTHLTKQETIDVAAIIQTFINRVIVLPQFVYCFIFTCVTSATSVTTTTTAHGPMSGTNLSTLKPPAKPQLNSDEADPIEEDSEDIEPESAESEDE